MARGGGSGGSDGRGRGSGRGSRGRDRGRGVSDGELMATKTNGRENRQAYV